MDAAAPSDAILVKGTYDRGISILHRLRQLDTSLAVASDKTIREAVSQGEAYLNEKLGRQGDYWELSTGFSFNLNPMFKFVGGRWKVRWRKSDRWSNVEDVTPPWGKGEAETKEVLEKLGELNRKLGG
jgi:hypothetical protein